MRVYELLRDAGVPVPEVVEIRRNQLVLSYAKGRTVLSIVDNLDATSLLHVNRELGRLLRRVHRIRFDEFGYIGGRGIVEPRGTNVEYMRHQFSRKLPALGDPGLRTAIEQRLVEAEPLLAACDSARLCHNDIHFGNVFVDEQLRISTLIDVENAVAADPLLDLAKAHCYQRQRDENTLAALAEGYGELPERWREVLDFYVVWHWLELWEWFETTNHPAAPEVLDDLRRSV